MQMKMQRSSQSIFEINLLFTSSTQLCIRREEEHKVDHTHIAYFHTVRRWKLQTLYQV